MGATLDSAYAQLVSDVRRRLEFRTGRMPGDYRDGRIVSDCPSAGCPGFVVVEFENRPPRAEFWADLGPVPTSLLAQPCQVCGTSNGQGRWALHHQTCWACWPCFAFLSGSDRFGLPEPPSVRWPGCSAGCTPERIFEAIA